MNFSPHGQRLLRDAEALRLEAYCDKCGKRVLSEHDTCSGGFATIGYGYKIPPQEMNLYIHLKPEITKDEAESLFQKTLKPYVAAVCKYLRVSVTQNQFDALVIFAYNCGISAFITSTLLKHINAKYHIDDIERLWMEWVHGEDGEVLQGLVNRRKSEFALYKTP